MMDRRYKGISIPDQIRIIAACNPYKLSKKKQEGPGLKN